jgi:hypothetical protein
MVSGLAWTLLSALSSPYFKRSRFSLAKFLGLAKSDSLSATIIPDEFDSSTLQRSTECSFIGEGYWDFPLDHLDSTDGCDADF